MCCFMCFSNENLIKEEKVIMTMKNMIDQVGQKKQRISFNWKIETRSLRTI